MQRKPTAIEGAPIVPEDVGEGEDARIDELSGVVAADAGSRLTPQQRAAARRAVSVSWFAAQFTDVSLGELQVIEWRGVVAVRGATRRRESAAATILRADVYRQVQTADGWGWQPSASNDAVMSTDDLAAACLAPLLLPPAAG